MKKQRLSLGAFPVHLRAIDGLINNQHILKHNLKLTSLYGSFPNVIWNGGRNSLHLISTLNNENIVQYNRECYDPETMEAVIRYYNEKGIGIRYTYSNNRIKRSDLSDTRANLTLEIAHNPQNGVITANSVIERYVRRHYPKYQLISSATAAKNLSIEYLKRRIDKVDLLVLPPEYNDRYDLIEKLCPDKIEILMNERCVPFCPNRSRHYDAISRSQIEFDIKYENDVYYSGCPVYNSKQRGEEIKTMILTDPQIKKLQKTGISNFKFVGRHLSTHEFVVDIDRLLVKDGYKMFPDN